MLEDVLSPAGRKTAYRVYKWLAFVVGLASLVVATGNLDNARVLLAVALANAGVNYLGAAIGKTAEDNTHPEV